MSLKISDSNNAIAFKAQKPVQEQKPANKTSSMSSAAVLASGAIGAAGGGALGAFGYAKPVYKDFDQLFVSADMSKIVEKLKDSKDTKILEILETYEDFETEKKAYKEHIDKTFKEENIPLDDFKKSVNYQEVCDDIPKFEERTKKITDFLEKQKTKEFTPEAFSEELGKVIDSPTANEVDDLMSYLNPDKEPKFTIQEEHINMNKMLTEYDKQMLENRKSFLEQHFTLAKDGKISKKALLEFHDKGYAEQILKETEKSAKVQWYNALEKHIPTKKLKPGLVGAAIGAVAVAGAVAIYSKMDNDAKKTLSHPIY